MVDAGPEPTYAVEVLPLGMHYTTHFCIMHALSITLSTYGHYSQVCTLFNNGPPRANWGANMSSRLPNLDFSATETSYNIKILHRISLQFEK